MDYKTFINLLDSTRQHSSSSDKNEGVDKNEMDKNGADKKTMEWIKKAVDKKKEEDKNKDRKLWIKTFSWIKTRIESLDKTESG